MSWSTTELGNLVEIRGGGTPSKAVPEYWNGDIPWASVKDLKTMELKETEDYVTADAIKKSASNLIPAGNIIVPTRMALGKVAINTVDMAINQDLKALIPIDQKKLDKGYLMRFLESQASFLEKQGKGATVKGITLDVLRSLAVPLPPLEEQKRIAAILDKADVIRRKRQQAIKLADDFLRSVFLEMFGDPVTNPKKWEVVNIEDVCSYIVDCINKTAKSVDYETPYKMIRTTNVRNMKIDLTDVRYVDKGVYEKWTSRLRPEIGDIVFTREAPAGEAGIIDFDDLVFLGQRTMQFRPDKNLITSAFLLHEMMGEGIKAQMEKMSSGSTVKHLSVPECKKFKVRRPPIELQINFEKLRSKTLSVLELENRAGDISLFESLSQKAFSGAL